MNRQSSVLLVVAHPDDEVLGFGATGTQLVSSGFTVKPVILCGNANARTRRPSDEQLNADMHNACETLGFEPPALGDFPNIKLNTVPHLDVVQFVEEHIRSTQPAHLFTHHPGDMNDDHRIVSNATEVASTLPLRQSEFDPLQSLSYVEISSSTDWAYSSCQPDFRPNVYQDISEDALNRKIAALSCYRGVMRSAPHPRSEECIRALATYRGSQRGMRLAESFQCVYRRGI